MTGEEDLPMPKYKHMFFYGGDDALTFAMRKQNSLGFDARVLTIGEAEKEGIELSREPPPAARSARYIVVDGLVAEPPESVPAKEDPPDAGDTPA